MPNFSFKAYRSDGKIEAGAIEASTEKDALKILNDRGLLPFETKLSDQRQQGRTHNWLSLGRRAKISPAELAEFTKEFSVLLKADLPVDNTLRLLATSSRSSRTSDIASKVLEELITGVSLSSAMETHLPSAPPIVSSLLKAGENYGNLAAAMEEIALHLERRASLSQQIRSALTYPIILAITAIAAIGIIVSVLVPALMPLFNDAGKEPPIALQLAHALSSFVSDHQLILAFLLLVFLLGLLLSSGSEKIARQQQNLLLSLPIFGSIKQSSETALIARTLGTLLRNGVPLLSALNTAREVATTDPFHNALSQASNSVQEGLRLDAALRKSELFPELAVRFIAVGEEVGRLDEMLLHLATTVETQLEQKIDRLMTMLGPSMTIVIGVIVGGLILSVMQAILGINEVALQ